MWNIELSLKTLWLKLIHFLKIMEIVLVKYIDSEQKIIVFLEKFFFALLFFGGD